MTPETLTKISYLQKNLPFEIFQANRLKFIIKIPKQVITKISITNNGSSEFEITTFNLFKTLNAYKRCDEKILLKRKFAYYDDILHQEPLTDIINNNRLSIGQSAIKSYEYAEVTLWPSKHSQLSKEVIGLKKFVIYSEN